MHNTKLENINLFFAVSRKVKLSSLSRIHSPMSVTKLDRNHKVDAIMKTAST